MVDTGSRPLVYSFKSPSSKPSMIFVATMPGAKHEDEFEGIFCILFLNLSVSVLMWSLTINPNEEKILSKTVT